MSGGKILIAMMLEEFVAEPGNEVAQSTETVEVGLAAVAAGGFDVAILDVHLRDGRDLDKPPERHRDRQFLSKPFSLKSLGKGLTHALDR